MDEPWIIFLEEFRDRAEILAGAEIADDEELGELLQETYEAASDRYQHQLDLRAGESRRLARAMGSVAEGWFRDGHGEDWDELETRLEAFQQEWDAGLGASPA
jgi:hypothetical protein